MAKAATMTIGVDGVEIAIEYNAVNNRVTQVSWTLPNGYAGRARVWNSGNLVLDRTLTGSGAESVPGNLRMVEVTEGGQTYLDLPANITWQLNIESIG